MRKHDAMKHESIVIRLSQMLFKLNQGERLYPQTLMQEFGVNLRTIQRDLNERLAYLPLEKINGGYQLNPEYLGRIGAHNIANFAALSGIKGLFPKLDVNFLKQFYLQQPMIQVHNQHYESMTNVQRAGFVQLEQAIYEQRNICFSYTKSTGETKKYLAVQPYRLIHHKSIWYLAAVHENKLKSFAFSRVHALLIESTQFELNQQIQQELDDEDSIWLGSKQTVILKITGEAMHYFRRRQLVPKQQTLEESESALVISTQVVHGNQILPIVRYWIPFVQILSPDSMRSDLNQQLEVFLQQQKELAS